MEEEVMAPLFPTRSMHTAAGSRLSERVSLLGKVALPARVLAAAALLAVLLATALSQGLLAHHSPLTPLLYHRSAASHKSLSSLPPAAQGAISAALGAKSHAYRIRSASEGGFQAANPAQRLHVRFGRAGVMLGSGATRLGFSLRAIGYGTSLTALGDVSPRVSANRVTYVHPGLREWYANGPLGLEQGFTLAQTPAAHPSGPLTLALALSGSAHAAISSAGHGLQFTFAGRPPLRYTALSASDARGRPLRSWLELHTGRLLLHVDTKRARYPLRIDPLIQQGSTFIQQGSKLTGGGESGKGEFGGSVALSADGSTALIGGLEDNGRVGAAWVFVRSGSTWTQQGSKLTGAGESGESGFGASVALSADGNTALIGGFYDNGGLGAAWVFTRSGSSWTQQGSKLIGGGGEIGEGYFGSSVALSADGNTALIGGVVDKGGEGAAWVFARSGSTWTQQGSALTGLGENGKGQFGSSVALSADGNTALIGGPIDNGLVGAAWVFTRSGSSWTQQGSKLTGGGEGGKGGFGYSVALSAGSTALIGGLEDNGRVGAAWVFTRSGSTWTQQGSKLTGGGEIGKGEFGSSAALSSDGNTALIGGRLDNGGPGAAWVFARSGGVWTQQGSKLAGGGESGGGEFGSSVALSLAGNTALIGGPFDNEGVGAAWVFTPKLTGGGESGGGEFGSSVALSADGNTALVGGRGDNREVGAAWVFTRSGSSWAQQGSKLTGGGESGEGHFGSSVVLSADGNTALIGGYNDGGAGAAWVFTRSGSTWTQQGSKLTGAGESGGGFFGSSVALSAGGDTALIGGRLDNAGAGAVWVFTRSGGVWTPQGSKLTGAGESGSGLFGSSVALSSDGNTALIGGYGDNSFAGAAWVFTRSGSTWTAQGSKLAGAGEIGKGEFGSGVALSSAGNSALIGGGEDNGGMGAAWVFTRSGSSWTPQGSKLTGGGEGGKGKFGYGVALSADGNGALIGGPIDNGSVGAAWSFARSGSTWTQRGSKLTGDGESGAGWLGYSVALSSDGNTLLSGGPQDSSSAGAAWVFVNPPTVTKVEPSTGPVGGGTTITITGTNLTGAWALMFGSSAATSFTVNSPSSITAVSPPGAGTVHVRVSAPGGVSATGSADQFTYVPAGPPPTVKKLSPKKGPAAGGTSVTITGTNFSGTTAVKFGSTSAASFSMSSPTSITAVSPPGRKGAVDVTVTTPNGTSASSKKDHFKYGR